MVESSTIIDFQPVHIDRVFNLKENAREQHSRGFKFYLVRWALLRVWSLSQHQLSLSNSHNVILKLVQRCYNVEATSCAKWDIVVQGESH